MSDKQRQDHLAAYWNGPVTRAEAQKVFDETATAVTQHQEVITKLDLVVSFLVEKGAYTREEIQMWMNSKVAELQAAHEAKQKAEQAAPSPLAPLEAEPSLIIQ